MASGYVAGFGYLLNTLSAHPRTRTEERHMYKFGDTLLHKFFVRTHDRSGTKTQYLVTHRYR